MLYYREATMSFCYSVLPISTMLYYREAKVLFCYSISHLSTMLYYRKGTVSFCYSILPISTRLYYREATVSFCYSILRRRAWPSGWDAALVSRRSRVQVLLPATGWICLRWPRIQLLHAL